jgi:two-component system sensor histidine kinase CpxA
LTFALATELLTLTRLESGTRGLDNVKIDLSALLCDVADDADFEARDRNRSVQVVEDEPTSINGAPEMIHSAIENVVRNAVRHTAEGSAVEVSLSSESINGDRLALVSVRDHGNGVPDEAIEEIFRPFYRVEPDRDRKTGGADLGLSIAARAVRLHYGTIKAFNAKDGGLVVEIRLPSG